MSPDKLQAYQMRSEITQLIKTAEEITTLDSSDAPALQDFPGRVQRLGVLLAQLKQNVVRIHELRNPED